MILTFMKFRNDSVRTLRLWLCLTAMALLADGGVAQVAPPVLDPLTAPASAPTPRPIATPEEQITLQFPRASVNDILSFYEALTGKRMIRDSKLGGDEISVYSRQPLPKSDAIRMIEAAMLLNGYTLLPMDAGTMKVLGPSKPVRSEGIPLIASPEDLPNSDMVVSYFMPLRYLSAGDAATIFSQFVKLNTYGSIVPIPSASAIVITDKTSLIRTVIGLGSMIDRPPAQVSTNFVTLQRANAEKVVEILDKMFSREKTATSAPPGQQPAAGEVSATASLLAAEAAAAQSVRFIADERTNRVVVVCKEELFPQVRVIVEQLDAAVDLEKPLERPLKYARASEVLPVLAKLIADSKDDLNQSSSGPTNSQNDNQGIVQNNSTGSDSSSYGGGGGGFGSSGGGGSDIGGGDSLRDPNQSTAPECVIVGKTRIIADSAANSIIVIGPPESRTKASKILDILDRKPLQIYLSTLIGELRVDNGMQYGVNYLIKFDQLKGGALLRSNPLATGTDILPDISKLVSGAITPALSGLTLYGAIADTVDVYARFLETTNRFRTLSRPVLYTTNNKKAVIYSGQEVPVPTTTLSNTTPGLTNSSAITANIDYKKVLLKLEVVPLINSNDEVTLVISQENNTIQGFTTVASQQVPIINTQKVVTTVTVPNRATVVLGGLISEDKQNDRNGIPYLSRIPVLGALFGTTNNGKIRRELVIMIQPVIVNNNEVLAEASAEEILRPETGAAVQKLGAPPTPTPSPTPKKRKNQY